VKEEKISHERMEKGEVQANESSEQRG